MKYCRETKLPIFIGAAWLATSCSFVQMRVSEPRVTIERMSTSSGRVSSAHFYRYRKAYLLRGNIIPEPFTILPIGGHVDIAVIAPDGSDTECKTTLQNGYGSHGRKLFSIRSEELPAPGSVVQVKHHDSPDHENCDG